MIAKRTRLKRQVPVKGIPRRSNGDLAARAANRSPGSGPARLAHGGKTIYGARIAMLLLNARFPRIPGDIGSATTWPFPVLFKVVREATCERINAGEMEGLLEAFIRAGQEAVAEGADGVVTGCGFLSVFQRELSAALAVPVIASAMMQVPFVERLLPVGKRAGILTISTQTLKPHHLKAAGVAPDTPVMGCEGGREFAGMGVKAIPEVAVDLCEQDILDAGRELVRRHPEVGAVVMECTNMPPFARALGEHLGLPVFDIYSFVAWMHAGLAPRDFGHPGSVPRSWRER